MAGVRELPLWKARSRDPDFVWRDPAPPASAENWGQLDFTLINVTAAEETHPSLNSSPVLPWSSSKNHPRFLPSGTIAQQLQAAPCPRAQQGSRCASSPSTRVCVVTRASPRLASPKKPPSPNPAAPWLLSWMLLRPAHGSSQTSLVFFMEKGVPSQRLVLSCWVAADKSLRASVSPVGTQSLRAWPSSPMPHFWPSSTVVWSSLPRGRCSNP